MRDAQLCKAIRELLLDKGKSRSHDLGMLGHVSLDAGKILEKAWMSELRELLGAHALDSEGGADLLDVLVARFSLPVTASLREKSEARTAAIPISYSAETSNKKYCRKTTRPSSCRDMGR